MLQKFFSLVVALTLFVPGTAFPGSELPGASNQLELVGQIGGVKYATAMLDSFALLGVGPRLLVVDASQPSQPYLAGQTEPLPGVVKDIFVVKASAGESPWAAVVLQEFGLAIVDLSSPHFPQVLGLMPFSGSPRSIYVARLGPSNAYHALVTLAYAGLLIADLSDLNAPVFAGSYPTSSAGLDISVSGNLAFLGSSNSGLLVLDVANPASPALIATYQPGGAIGAVAVAQADDGKTYAYLAGESPRALYIADVSSPAQPVAVGSLSLPGTPLEIAVSGNLAYLVQKRYLSGGQFVRGGLQIVNLANRASPALAGFYTSPGWAADVALGESALANYAFLADESRGLRIVNVSNPGSPVEAGWFDTPDVGIGVDQANGYAYVADGEGVRIFNISNPASPVEVGYYSTGGDSVVNVTVVSPWGTTGRSYAFVSAGSEGLRIVDVTNPVSPNEVAAYDPSDFIWDSAVSAYPATGHIYAFLAGEDGYLRVVDITNPAAPVEIAAATVSGFPQAVAVDGNYAYVATYTQGLSIFDVSNPQNPQFVKNLNLGYTNDVSVIGTHAFLAEARHTVNNVVIPGGLRILDVTDPHNPVSLCTYDAQDYTFSLTVRGDYGYLAESKGGMFVVGLSGSLACQEIAAYDSPGSAYRAAPGDGVIYLADESAGLLVLRFDEPTTMDVDSWVDLPTRTGVKPGGTASVRIKYGNLGLTTATSVELTASLGEGLVYIGDTSGITPTVSINEVHWLLPNLEFGALSAFDLVVGIPDVAIGTSYSLNLAIASAGPEAHADNNTRAGEVFAAHQLFLPALRR